MMPAFPPPHPLGLIMLRLSPSDFPPEQLSAWIDASDHGAGRGGAAGGQPEGDKVEWFVGYTDPRCEESVAKRAKRHAIRTYVPQMTVTRSRKDVSRPLLPRYLFLGLADEQSLFVMRETPGFEGLVRAAGSVVTVPATVIDGLRTQEREGVFDFTDGRAAAREAYERGEWIKAFVPGLEVRIVDGPFASFLGLVDRVLLPDRISVVVTIFGRPFPVPMMLDHVRLE